MYLRGILLRAQPAGTVRMGFIATLQCCQVLEFPAIFPEYDGTKSPLNYRTPNVGAHVYIEMTVKLLKWRYFPFPRMLDKNNIATMNLCL